MMDQEKIHENLKKITRRRSGIKSVYVSTILRIEKHLARKTVNTVLADQYKNVVGQPSPARPDRTTCVSGQAK